MDFWWGQNTGRRFLCSVISPPKNREAPPCVLPPTKTHLLVQTHFSVSCVASHSFQWPKYRVSFAWPVEASTFVHPFVIAGDWKVHDITLTTMEFPLINPPGNLFQGLFNRVSKLAAARTFQFALVSPANFGGEVSSPGTQVTGGCDRKKGTQHSPTPPCCTPPGTDRFTLSPKQSIPDEFLQSLSCVCDVTYWGSVLAVPRKKVA